MTYERAVVALMRGSGWPRRDVERDPESAWWRAVSVDKTAAVHLGEARDVVLEGRK